MQGRRFVGLLLAGVTLWVGLLVVAVAQHGENPKGPEISATDAVVDAAVDAVIKPQTLLERASSIIVILVVSCLIYWIVVGSLRRAMRVAEEKSQLLPGISRDRQQRVVTIISMAMNIVRWVICFVALVWLLGALGINLLPLLTGVGFLGAAIAFGSQTLVKDIVSGFFLLLEGQYAVGDYVELGGKFGMVEGIGLRTTILKDVDNQCHHIPNGSITACTVYEEHFVNYVLHVPIAEAADTTRAAECIEQSCAAAKDQLPFHLLAVEEPRIEASEEGVSEVKVTFSVFPTQEWVATGELPSRAKIALAKHGIAAPEGMAPHSEVDLSRMPVPPLSEEDEAQIEEGDMISRWKLWAGKGDEDQ